MIEAATEIQAPPARRLTTREIARTVAAIAGERTDELVSRNRACRLVTLRWVVMRLARAEGRSLHQIGRALGRDHTTVLHGLRASRYLGNRDPQRARLIAEVEAAARQVLGREEFAP